MTAPMDPGPPPPFVQPLYVQGLFHLKRPIPPADPDVIVFSVIDSAYLVQIKPIGY